MPSEAPHNAQLRGSGLKLEALHASSDAYYETAHSAAGRLHTGALVIGPDTFLPSHARNQQLALLATRDGIPAISFTREFGAGGSVFPVIGACCAAAYRGGTAPPSDKDSNL
jgi:hypothetical protein